MAFNPRLGFLLFFEGDHRKLNVTIGKVSSFSAVSATLKQGDSDVTSTYITSTITSAGNLIQTDDIGGKASMPAGNYRYYIAGTYSSKVRTWYIDILVLAKDLDQLPPDFPLTDYDPFIEEVVSYEGDHFTKVKSISGADFSAVTGVFKLGSEDKTATYCSGSASASGEQLTTHDIGGVTTIPAGQYGYFLTATWNNSEAVSTWFYRVTSIAKQSII